jgi:hypothetical protein
MEVLVTSEGWRLVNAGKPQMGAGWWWQEEGWGAFPGPCPALISPWTGITHRERVGGNIFAAYMDLDPKVRMSKFNPSSALSELCILGQVALLLWASFECV